MAVDRTPSGVPREPDVGVEVQGWVLDEDAADIHVEETAKTLEARKYGLLPISRSMKCHDDCVALLVHHERVERYFSLKELPNADSALGHVHGNVVCSVDDHQLGVRAASFEVNERRHLHDPAA